MQQDSASLIGRIHSLESFGAVDGPGVRFVAFMQGCPMRCQFCHNPDTWDPHGPVQFEWTPQQLVAEVRRYRSFIRRGGVTVSGGEPLMQAPFVAEFFRLCHEEGFHTALDTSGALFTPLALAVLPHTDLVLLDVKTPSDEMHPAYTGLPRTNPQRWLEHLAHIGKPVWIRHVVVPGRTDSDESLLALARLVKPYLAVIERVELLSYHVMGAYKYASLSIPYPLEGVEPLSADAIAHARKVVSDALPGVRVG